MDCFSFLIPAFIGAAVQSIIRRGVRKPGLIFYLYMVKTLKHRGNHVSGFHNN